MKQILLACSLLLLSSSALVAQKFGHLNRLSLVADMPEVKAADAELEAYQKQLVNKGEEMAQAFQEKYTQFASDVQNGVLSPVQQQERQQELQAEQQEIAQYEQEIRQNMQAKQEELYQPIFAKVQEAIDAVGDENGYQMIFDTSTSFNAILFALDSDDVESMVRAKLGLP